MFAKLPEAPKPKKIKHKGSQWSTEWYSEESQELTIKAKGPLLIEVVAFPYSFLFRTRTVTVNYMHYGESGHWHFDVEEKIYTDSNHNSKLHYDGSSLEEKKKQIELINAFVDKLMEGITPEPRFNLAKYHAAQEKKKTKVKAAS